MSQNKHSQQIPLVELLDSAVPEHSRDLQKTVNETAEKNVVYAADQAGPGKTIQLQFSLALENGHLIDSCFDKPAVSFEFGDGNLLPGFEQTLCGLRKGEGIEIKLLPELAFGLYRQENIQQYPRFRFPPDMEIAEGLMIDFTDTAGNTQAGVIRKADSNQVEVDFNHPLAGRTIHFKALIYDVSESPAGN